MFLCLPDVDPSIVAEAEAALERFLPVLDRQLAGKEHVLGKLSIVDFAISPPPRWHCDITGRPQPLSERDGLAGGYASKVVLERHIGWRAASSVPPS